MDPTAAPEPGAGAWGSKAKQRVAVVTLSGTIVQGPVPPGQQQQVREGVEAGLGPRGNSYSAEIGKKAYQRVTVSRQSPMCGKPISYQYAVRALPPGSLAVAWWCLCSWLGY